MTAGLHQGRLAGQGSSGVPLILIELSGAANGRQPARQVAMRARSVAGSRR